MPLLKPDISHQFGKSSALGILAGETQAPTLALILFGMKNQGADLFSISVLVCQITSCVFKQYIHVQLD